MAVQGTTRTEPLYENELEELIYHLQRSTVVDATDVQRGARKPLVSIARQYHCLPVAIVFNFPEKICKARNKLREDRNFGPHVIRQKRSQLRRSIKGLKREGYRDIFTIDSEDESSRNYGIKGYFNIGN